MILRTGCLSSQEALINDVWPGLDGQPFLECTPSGVARGPGDEIAEGHAGGESESDGQGEGDGDQAINHLLRSQFIEPAVRGEPSTMVSWDTCR